MGIFSVFSITLLSGLSNEDGYWGDYLHQLTPETLQREIQSDFTPIECASMA